MFARRDIKRATGALAPPPQPPPISDIRSVDIRTPCNILITGVRSSGKTQLFRYFALKRQDLWDHVVCFVGDGKLSHDYDPWRESTLEPNDNYALYSLMEAQRELTRTGRVFRILIVFDDIVGTWNSKNQDRRVDNMRDLIGRLVTSGRHIQISAMFLVQRCTIVPPVVRDNSDIIIATKLDRESVADYLFRYQSTYASKEGLWSDFSRHIRARQFGSMFLFPADPGLPPKFLGAVPLIDVEEEEEEE